LSRYNERCIIAIQKGRLLNMINREAKARIKINKMLEEADWRLVDDVEAKANVLFETNVKINDPLIENFGDDFENCKNGYADFVLLDNKNFPIAVLEAKSESIQPLSRKEQARQYAKALKCRFIILSNGNLSYFWDIDTDNPTIITKFPSLSSLTEHINYQPDTKRLFEENIDKDYIVLTQKPNYADFPDWQDQNKRDDFIKENRIRFLQPYQLKAVKKIQEESQKGKNRFLLEMATGTGKTLTAAAIIKLFLKTSNANRVLFLVDRIELENQAKIDSLRPMNSY
jgi:type I restriction enzyme R subunit